MFDKLRRWFSGIIILLTLVNLYYILRSEHRDFSQTPSISRPVNFKTNSDETSFSRIDLSLDVRRPSVSGASLSVTNRTEEYVAICVAVKNQAFDLPEFIQHHYFHLGIKRFYIMDDASVPPLADLLTSADLGGVPSSAITFAYRNPTKRKKTMQFYLYNMCIRHFGHRHTWMAFIDTDEFFEMTGHPSSTLNDFLRGFEDDMQNMLPSESPLRGKIGAVAVSWRVHNSNGMKKRPPQGDCRKTFTSCFQDLPKSLNRVYKSIVRTEWYDYCGSPHFFQLLDDRKTVGELGDLLGNSHIRLPITRTHIALHHYIVKSEEEFKEKIMRGSAVQRDWTFWDEVLNTPNITCNELASYRP